MPVPSSQRPSRRVPGRGSRSAQPNLRAPSRKQAARLRLLNGSPETGPTTGSLRSRSSIGSTPARVASSSRAASIANDPGASPGARIQVGDGTSSRTTWLAVRCASASYITRATPALGSTNSYTVDVWFSERCSRASNAAVGVRPEPDPLGGGTAVAAQREGLAPGQHHAHRALQGGGGHHGGHLVGAQALAAEAAADVLGAHPHRGRVEREHRGQLALHPARALVGVDDLQLGRRPSGRSPRAAPSCCAALRGWCTARPPRRRTRPAGPPGRPSPSLRAYGPRRGRRPGGHRRARCRGAPGRTSPRAPRRPPGPPRGSRRRPARPASRMNGTPSFWKTAQVGSGGVPSMPT